MTIDEQVDYAMRKHVSAYRAEFARKRRQRLKRARLCINAASHGRPKRGHTKCAACVDVHRGSR
jgi:hypothetical protein